MLIRARRGEGRAMRPNHIRAVGGRPLHAKGDPPSERRPRDDANRAHDPDRWWDDDALRLLDWVERDPWGTDGDEEPPR